MIRSVFRYRTVRIQASSALRNEADTSDSLSKFASTVSNAGRGDIDGLSIQEGILVKHDVDVRGIKIERDHPEHLDDV